MPLFPDRRSARATADEQRRARSGKPRSGKQSALLLAVAMLGAAYALFQASQSATAQATGRVRCRITENGQPASGTLSLRGDGDQEVAKGTCGEALAVPPGQYTAVIGLDGALDRPQQRQPVRVQAGESSRVAADFKTAVLEVRIESGGRRVAGMASIRSGDRQIGTLGSGVAAHISAGSYEIVTRYRSQEQRRSVQLSPGERRKVSVSF